MPDPPEAGTPAPDFPLGEPQNNPTTLRHIVQHAIVVPVFSIGYTRGGCRRQPVGPPGALPDFVSLGAGVFAVTAESAQGVLRAIHEWKPSFVVALDPKRKTIRRHGVLNPVSGRGIARYRPVGTAGADRPDARTVLGAAGGIAGAGRS
jgi:peroxiredoxin